MNSRRTRLALAGILALALSVTAGLGTSAQAKKKKVKPVTFSQTVAVNAGIPDAAVAAGPSTPVRSDITLGSKFKGKVISDLDLTNVQTTGSAANALNDLTFKLTAPNKRTVVLIEGLGGQSLGPLTVNDDTKTGICDSATPTCRDPDATLLQPFAGTANNIDQDDDLRPMSSFNGVPMKGTWQLTVFDNNNTLTSTLVQWGLKATGVTAPK